MGAELSLCNCDETRGSGAYRNRRPAAGTTTPRDHRGPSNPSTMGQDAWAEQSDARVEHADARAFNPEGPAPRASSKASYFDNPDGAGSNEPCGIGIQFRTDRTGAMVVQDLIKGGPADESNQVFEGDVLYMVDNKLVLRSPLNQVSGSLLGARGSRVTVVFLRNGQHVKVTLTRAPGFKIGGVQSSPAVLAAKGVVEMGGAVGMSPVKKGRPGEPMDSPPRTSAFANTQQ
eukprot:Tamp_22973.p1 GENE.Tamp_22973~~Tamp_22973.p1  ORF type:complete len:231 (-),score=25.53 Tamp_22973:309-1001(-)